MLKIIAAATLSAMCRDLGRCLQYSAGLSHRYSNVVRSVAHNLRNFDLD